MIHLKKELRGGLVWSHSKQNGLEWNQESRKIGLSYKEI